MLSFRGSAVPLGAAQGAFSDGDSSMDPSVFSECKRQVILYRMPMSALGLAGAPYYHHAVVLSM
eukprot:scaffold266133_cov31-Tisochrysis_lutea.AAC.2